MLQNKTGYIYHTDGPADRHSVMQSLCLTISIIYSQDVFKSGRGEVLGTESLRVKEPITLYGARRPKIRNES
jgi:hypothetical protein